MWKYSGKTIQEGRAWIGEGGIQNSPQWNLWTVAEKEAAGLTEFTPERSPDSRSTPKSLDDTLVADGDGSPVFGPRGVVGVQSELISKVKATQYRLLSETDWAIIRRADTGTEVPGDIQTWRDAIRVKATEMEKAIDAAADTAALAALFAAETLADWPALAPDV